MNAIEIALQKAGLYRQETETCWGCGEPLPEISWFWPNVVGPRFCSEGCCLAHPFTEDRGFDTPLATIVNTVLDAWGLPYDQKFYSPDGLVVISLLCNAAAKGQEYGIFPAYPDFYDLKPVLIKAAAKRHTHVWKQDDEDSLIVYFETCVGQISFHVFPEESDFFNLLPNPNGREWRGGWMQDEAIGIALAFLGNGDDELELDLRRFLATSQGW